MHSDVRELVRLLGPLCRDALERAAQLCVAQTNYNVEIEHLLVTLLEAPVSDIADLLRRHDIEPSVVSGELARGVERLQRGNGRTPVFSPHLFHLLERSWLISSLLLRDQAVRSSALLLALLEEESLRGVVVDSCPSLLRVPRDELRAGLPTLAPQLPEAGRRPETVAADDPGRAPAGRSADEKGGALALYTVDLTRMAREGKIDPVTGRDSEIRQILDVITRRRQNNPILTGEAGVGKTAIVEGFAMRVAAGDVPPGLKGTVVRALDLGALQAGAGVKGEFENRIRGVVDEVRASPTPIILFVDEAHTLIGAGGKEGSGDAANLLKPALARGELRMIAATTWSEYKRYMETDPALARRFQVVKVEEPAERDAIDMLRGITLHLERHHGVRILDEAAVEAVRLSQRYITGRQLPDKAISVLDTACARVALGQNSMPGEVEDSQRKQERLQLEIRILEREEQEGGGHGPRLAELRRDFSRAETELEEITRRWQRERELAGRIRGAREQLAGSAGGADRQATLDDVARAEADLNALQNANPLVPLHVDGRAVAQVVAAWTGIPIRKMLRDDVRSAMTLRGKLEDRIVGQPEALEAIASRIRTYQASLDDPSKPVGVFLLAGPSGVGKTETAITLAEYLYGGERNMVSVDMSEFQEAHSVSLLKGAPPGYVGFGRGGILTEAVRRRPYSLVLLDEIEKAHPDVVELFYQVFDKGKLEDAEGQLVDFKNTLIILTTNVGEEVIRAACRGGRPTPEVLMESLRPELLRHFRPAFLGRMVVIPYYPLDPAELEEIVRLKLADVQRRFWEAHRSEMTYDESVVAELASRCGDEESGARNVDRILTQTLLPELSTLVLEYMARGEPFGAVHIGLDPEFGLRYRFGAGTPA